GEGFEPTAAPAEKPQSPPGRMAPAIAAHNARLTLGEFVADLETSLGEDFLPAAAAAKIPGVAASIAAPVVAPVPAPTASAPIAHVRPASAPVAAAAAPARAVAPHAEKSAHSGLLAPNNAIGGITDLSAMFSELKGELEEDTVSTAAD